MTEGDTQAIVIVQVLSEKQMRFTAGFSRNCTHTLTHTLIRRDTESIYVCGGREKRLVERRGEKETRQRDGGRTEHKGWVTLDVLRVIDYKVSIPHH